MARKHSVDEVLKTLNKKKDVKINPASKTIYLLTGNGIPKNNDLGNNSWGKIDYLKNHLGFKVSKVDEFPKSNF